LVEKIKMRIGLAAIIVAATLLTAVAPDPATPTALAQGQGVVVIHEGFCFA
jgi:hypothetical protein